MATEPGPGAEMGDGGDEPIRFTDSLNRVVRALRPGDEASTDVAAIGGVFHHWDEAVGPSIAAHARPLRLDGTQLTVAVDDPVWAVQVRFFTEMIISRLAEVANATVTTIHVRVQRP